MTAALAEIVAVCWDCGGPCLTYKGSKHGWRCRACIDRYLDEAAAKADAYDERNRQQRIARSRNTMTSYQGGSADVSRVSAAADDRRRDDGLAAGRVVSASISEDKREDNDR
ncbi:hypothetical protein [Mycobacterium bourgelatii]|uniref:Uncharacterized protein n=1 Tax=Mycobacterium bourgelatii TaxID=1273442 RepID=A0A7I9YVR5_MYCBU|nr:hypothetical protein [Mycobacterium bourgelatii]MCV6976276.1 hypothetical protein [Mycobacterium bourgelatii]GFG92667.1 hypothetical protein MBOU_47090 [Mycobacterium bourgelatii]